jgi:anti-sigma regulatory factor (Ser/Thr protein kinase)
MASELSKVRHAIDTHLAASTLAAESRRDVVLCASEAAANALLHSGGDLSRPVVVTVECGVVIVVSVTDHGSWKAPAAGRVGRGLGIINGLATHLAIDTTDDGTTVRFDIDPNRLTKTRRAPSLPQ